MSTFDPLAPIYVPPIVPLSAIDRAPQPVNPAQDPGVPGSTPTAVPVSARKTTPPPVVPGVATGTSVTSTNSVPLLDITTNAANVTPASVTGNIIIPAVTRPGGNVGAIQFNNGNTFAGSNNLTFNGSTIANIGYGVPILTTMYNSLAGGILNTTGEIRVGNINTLSAPGSTAGFTRLRYQRTGPVPGNVASWVPFYGFTASDNQFTALTYENNSFATVATVMGATPAYSASGVPGYDGFGGQGTVFGISGSAHAGPGYSNHPVTTGNADEIWRPLLNLDGRGNLTIGGGITMTPPPFHPWFTTGGRSDPYGSAVNCGITFADGTFQNTAYQGSSPVGATVNIREDGVAVVSSNTINFVGPTVTASNVSGIATVTVSAISGISVTDEGFTVIPSANAINFTGAGVTASNVSGVATITIPGASSGVTIRDEGTNVVSSANTINFTGSGVTASNVSGVATITVSGGAAAAGNITEVQYNNGNTNFGANYNFVYNNGGLFVGGIGNATANATGIITANSEFRVGLWSYDGSVNGDKYGRIRMGSDSRVKADPYYGFIGDPNINPFVGIPNRTLVTTNEELETKQATVLMDAQTYPANVASQGTVFGVSGIDLSYANSFQPTTGTEAGWYKFIDVTNTGNVKIGGSLVISPGFQRTPPANANVGIYFADGTFQYTAAGRIAVQEEGSNVVASASTMNFVGAGVTASNVGGVATITIAGGGSGITVQEESSTVVATATTVNFLGAGVTASNVGGVAVVTVPGGVNTMYGGSSVTTPAETINFVGPLANVTNVGFGTNTTDVTIGLTVQDESTVISGNAAIGTLNFLGAGVTVTAGPTGVANITIPSGGGTPGSPNASIQFNDNGSFAGNTYFTFNKTNGNVDMGLGNLTVSNGNITGYTNGIPLGYKYLPGNSVTGNRDISSADIGGYIVKWGNSDITLTTPGFPGDTNLPVGTKIEIFNANPTGNANIVAGSGGGTSTVLVGPRPNAEGILSYVQVGPYEQVTMVKLGVSASNVYTGNSVVWFCYGSAYPLGVAYP